MPEPTIRLTGLTKLDVKQFERAPGVTFEEVSVPKGSHGEVALFTAVIAMSALSALAAYILRKHNYQTFEETIEIVHPDGRVVKHTIKWEAKKSEAPEAELIKQIRGSVF
jgi:hypothetical protein